MIHFQVLIIPSSYDEFQLDNILVHKNTLVLMILKRSMFAQLFRDENVMSSFFSSFHHDDNIYLILLMINLMFIYIVVVLLLLSGPRQIAKTSFE